MRKTSKFRVWGSLGITYFHPISENVRNILMYICVKFGACITKCTILWNILAKPWHYRPVRILMKQEIGWHLAVTSAGSYANHLHLIPDR